MNLHETRQVSYQSIGIDELSAYMTKLTMPDKPYDHLSGQKWSKMTKMTKMNFTILKSPT